MCGYFERKRCVNDAKDVMAIIMAKNDRIVDLELCVSAKDAKIAALDKENIVMRQQMEKLIADRDALQAQLADFHAAVQHVTEDGKTTRSYITSDGWAMVHAGRLSDLEVTEERENVLMEQASEDSDVICRLKRIIARLRAILASLIAHADRHDYAPPYMLNVQQCREIREAVNGNT